MNNIVINFGIIFLIIILIFYMLYIIYNCKKNDNKLYIEKLTLKGFKKNKEHFTLKKGTEKNIDHFTLNKDTKKYIEHFTFKKGTKKSMEHFNDNVEYNRGQFSTKQNNCLNKWITRKEGMAKYLNSLDEKSRNIVITAVINVECKPGMLKDVVEESGDGDVVEESGDGDDPV